MRCVRLGRSGHSGNDRWISGAGALWVSEPDVIASVCQELLRDPEVARPKRLGQQLAEPEALGCRGLGCDHTMQRERMRKTV